MNANIDANIGIKIDKADTITDGPRFLRRIRTRFSSLTPGDHLINIPIGNTRIQFRARIVAGSKKLLFTFHGAVNRDNIKSTPFNSFFPALTDTNQIAVSDPSLLLSREFRVGWFAGHAGFDTQFHLRGALRTITKALEAERTIYFGSSAGGFAALYFSYFAPRSIALVFNPQTSITAYHDSHVAPYRTICWPDVASTAELAQATCADVTALYAQGFRNTVIYCQSMGDWHHTARHMLPFVGAIADKPQARRLLLYSDYKGQEGHVSDYDAYREWAMAATSSPSDDPKDLLNVWQAIRNRPKPGAEANAAAAAAPAAPFAAPVAAPGAKAGFRAEDIETAQRLRAFLEASR